MFCFKGEQRGVAVSRYVIMPNHVHLFAAFPMRGIALSVWVQSLRGVLGKQLLRAGIQKSHWHEGFFDHLLRSHESHAQKWEYMHTNPVRAQLSNNSRRLAIPRTKLFRSRLPEAGCCNLLARRGAAHVPTRRHRTVAST